MVAPSILSADFANLEKEIKAVAQAGADWIHVDVMDGRFVPNITIGIPVVKALKKVSPLPLDVHLMIEEPERYVEEFVKAGSDYLTIHVESTKDAAGTLKRIRELGAKPGITLRPRTAVEEVLPLLPLCDLVLVMTVEPGFGGQSFMNDQVAKITRLRQEISSKHLSCLIEVDGGINAETAKICHEADVFVAGSYVFGKEYGSAIASLKGS
ncbi:Ribulose-phosphate 3-epimerase [Bdellovibrio bacteriovorus]|uniref:ribulose-phosphate 3-epimerase n=1 Tax=Bdellovibrio bacteriovorus TaxID=959 RepID=UPI00045C035A|nr:ribulose-phosphate 3-epimerase [Bdellovibrio bacteriovorus]BEV69143.1 Ribulose-phosphate 3-epimerase [Bdellovibrio bacteriovorus]